MTQSEVFFVLHHAINPVFDAAGGEDPIDFRGVRSVFCLHPSPTLPITNRAKVYIIHNQSVGRA